MKKIIFAFCAAVAGLGAAGAQDNMLQFLPNEEGTQIISKSYDANNVHQATMTMTIMDHYEYIDGQELDINYVITDADGNTLNTGKIDAEYNNGTFMLHMKSGAISPTIGRYISTTSELTGDFLDYPNYYADPMQLESKFIMDGGTFTISSAETKRPIAQVYKYGRQIEGSEEVTTPAGTFDATKITFSLQVEENGEKSTYRGVEWYTPGSGVVRSEIYDNDRNLLDYTVLTAIEKPHRRR
ncbi:MAG: hypothetical protein LIO77_00170 [Rikenellaceae bacterium]|nr:hypothetical protein [Rikenellaceae bacterium]